MKRTNWIERIACAALTGAVLWACLGTVSAQTAKATAEKSPASLAKPAATVNGEAITFAQLEPILKAVGPIPVELPEAQRREMQREALSMLIDDLLLQQFLRKNAPAVSPVEIDKKMAELTAGLKNKNKSLEDFYKETGQTEGDLRTNLSNVLAWSGYADKRVTEAEVRKYYDTFKDFFDKVTVRASHICLRVAADATEKDRAAARTKLLDLRTQVQAGKLDFAVAAKQHSQCPTGPNGGDVGSFPRKFVVDENFARAAFALKVGEVSDVVQTDFGLHIIKVTERKAGQPSDFSKIKEEVKDFYLEELRHQILVQLRKVAKIEVHLP